MRTYENSKIYKVICNITGETYYGSTTRTLDCRLKDHECHADETAIRSILERNNYEMLLVENFICDNKNELLWRERWWIENNDCINIRLPIHTAEEIKAQQQAYRDANKEQTRGRGRAHYQANKGKRQEREKCECGEYVSNWCMNRHLKTATHKFNMLTDDEKQQINKSKEEAKKARNKIYCDVNRETRKLKCGIRNGSRMMCECGTEIIKGYKSTHIKTKKHLDLIANQN